MQRIETVADVNKNGLLTIALPVNIRPGKHHIVLVIDEALSEENIEPLDHAQQLMQMAGRVSAFKTIDDPVKWQQQQRDEWKRDWDKS